MKELDIAKFGGTSVKDFEAMSSSARVVLSNPNTRLVVVSACAGVTNLLVELASGALFGDGIEAKISELRRIHMQIIDKILPSERERCVAYLEEHLKEISDQAREASMGRSDALTDRIVCHGELLSSYLIVEVFRVLGAKARVFDVRQVMRTDSNYGQANPLVEVLAAKARELLCPLLEGGELVVTQGFIGSNSEGCTTTLGRGGSDYTASL